MTTIATTEQPSSGVGLVTLDLSASGGFLSWEAANSLAEITRADVVTIAAINGDCGGGGAELG